MQGHRRKKGTRRPGAISNGLLHKGRRSRWGKDNNDFLNKMAQERAGNLYWAHKQKKEKGGGMSELGGDHA